MRGKVHVASAVPVGMGITPARAGKRGQRRSRLVHGWDHPRACGEKAVINADFTTEMGSPPRVRGKDQPHQRVDSRTGITPARAGKSRLRSRTYRPPRDHPRACGEKMVCRGGDCVTQGSPPRVRGKDPAQYPRRSQAGITPARAGKRLKHIPYLLCSCAKHLFTPQFCVDNLCQLAVGYSAVSLNIR